MHPCPSRSGEPYRALRRGERLARGPRRGLVSRPGWQREIEVLGWVAVDRSLRGSAENASDDDGVLEGSPNSLASRCWRRVGPHGRGGCGIGSCRSATVRRCGGGRVGRACRVQHSGRRSCDRRYPHSGDVRGDGRRFLCVVGGRWLVNDAQHRLDRGGRRLVHARVRHDRRRHWLRHRRGLVRSAADRVNRRDEVR